MGTIATVDCETGETTTREETSEETAIREAQEQERLAAEADRERRSEDADQGTGAMANTAGIRAKCKAVLAGTDTFTPAQLQRAVAALVLLALRDRADT